MYLFSSLLVGLLKLATEQLLYLRNWRNQQPLRDQAIFLVLLRTGSRVLELLRLDLQQYQGKHFVNVSRKDQKVTRSVFVAREALEALDAYINGDRARKPGRLICSRSGKGA